MRRPPLVTPIAAVLAVTACGSPAASSTSGGEELTGTLTVFAAASLTDVFTEMGAQLEDG